MNDLKNWKEEDIVKGLKEGTIKAADLTDSSICPTCFDRTHDNVVYPNSESKILYEDEDLECFLVGKPRAEGHVAISTKKHFKDMMEADPEICTKVFQFAQKAMILLKEVYQAESVYLCTMCDGPMNHFHVQLIPRYSYELRGSDNFVKPRKDYIENKEKMKILRESLKEK